MIPKGGGWGFFGWHTVDLNVHTDIIITEGEYDAMAVSEALSMLPLDHPLRDVPTVSLPNGCNSFPPDLIPLLEQFRRIYLWLDDDKSGREGCEKLATKLGKHRCWVVQPLTDVSPRPKDANDALRMMKPAPPQGLLEMGKVPPSAPSSSPSSSSPFLAPSSPIPHTSNAATVDSVVQDSPSSILPSSGETTAPQTTESKPKRWRRRSDQPINTINTQSVHTDGASLGSSYSYSTATDPKELVSTKAAKDLVWGLYEGRNIIAEMIEAATIPRHHRIEQFSDRKEEVIAAILSNSQGNERVGTQTPSLDPLCALVKGFRRGELVVFTGPTGSGKTTLLSQLSIDFAKEGVPTLWGSFEIKNLTLMKKMLTQYHPGQDIKALKSTQLRQLADDFEALPLSFMNFHGASHIDEIIEAIDFCIYRDDVEHIIIDNLQFMMPRREAGVNMAMSKFDMQDMVVDRLRKLATEKNVNVILVVHPRKEQDDFALGISSIFGTAKATQEADVVLILQNRKVMKDNVLTPDLAIDVRKNRYDGHLGSIKLAFNSGRSSFYELKEDKK